MIPELLLKLPWTMTAHIFNYIKCPNKPIYKEVVLYNRQLNYFVLFNKNIEKIIPL